MECETLRFLEKDCPFEPGDSVLDCLTAAGLAVASSCYAGSCGACVLRAVNGTVSPRAQSRLHSGARAAGEFLSCVCPARADLHVEPVDRVESVGGRIDSVQRVDDSIVRVLVRIERPLKYRAGQVVHLVRPSDGMSSPCAITSLPDEPRLELYLVERHRGALCPWFEEATGKDVVVRGPSGHFFYMNDPREPLVLIGSGVAIAPVLGVLRTAIGSGHCAPIVCIRLAERSDHHFRRCLERQAAMAVGRMRWNEVVVDSDDSGRVERALGSIPRCLSGARVYLAGESMLLRKLRLRVFGRGADPDRIHRFALMGSHLAKARGKKEGVATKRELTP